VITVAARGSSSIAESSPSRSPGAANGDDHLTAGRAERHDLDAARQENDNGSRVVALVKERDAGAVPARPADGPQIVGLDL
jgi:hypothetical protein